MIENKDISRQSPSAIPAEVSFYEKHKKIYVRDVKGWWTSWRWALVWITQILFYGAPWLQWNDRQAILFHLVDRKFYLFGLVLWPQDVFYLAVLLIISAYVLFLFTAIAGRLFCGYACPQTVYSEIFMWVEARIEGDRSSRMKLDSKPMNAKKFALKSAKHLIWILISLWTGFTLVAYFSPTRELLSAFPLGFSGWEIFWTLFYAGFCYMQAGFLREQVCKYMCPYARFQGVMFDPDTLIISYDPERGEPRGPRRKNAAVDAQKLGDCIDCHICVQVCPTGIDIRQGLQLECIACAACIDACDEVMDKVNLPRGLIRYSTENALARHYSARDILAHLMRPRTLIYSAILLIIVAATAWSLATRIPLRVDVIRDRAMLYREADNEQIENVFSLHVMNTHERPRRYRIEVNGIEGVTIVGEQILGTVFKRDRAVFHDVAAMRDLERLVGVLFDEEDGGVVLGVDLFDDLEDLLDDQRGEAQRGFVEQ